MESERFFHGFYHHTCKSLSNSGPFHPGYVGENSRDPTANSKATRSIFEEYCQDSNTLKSFLCTAIVLAQNTSSDKTDTGKENNSICTEIC